MKIILNDVTEEIVDKLENALINMVNVHTYIWEGICNDVYMYEIDITEEPGTELDYSIEHVDVLFKKGSYIIEIMNARQVSTVEIKANEVMSILIK